MPFLPIRTHAADRNPASITQTIVAGLLPFFVAGCSTPKLAVTPVEPTPSWAIEYTVRTDESNLMALTYGWRFAPLRKERVEVYLRDDDRKRVDFLFQSVLEYNPTGVTSSWGNPTTGYNGAVTPTRTVTHKNRPPCRDFVIVVNIGGNEAHGYGRYIKETGSACRDDAGIWQVLEG